MTQLFGHPHTKVGITASRHGVSPIQGTILTTFLQAARLRGGAEFHQGCCVGGDARGTEIARWLGYRVVGHPPVMQDCLSTWAVENSDELRHPLTYLARDRAIVRESDVLIGLPNGDQPRRHSGTWYTVSYARERNLPRLVVGPDGRVIDHVGVEDYLPLNALATLGADISTTEPRFIDVVGEESA